MSTESTPLEVLFVGSSPFDSTSDFLNTVIKTLSSHVSRLPDGETGSRSNFIGWQHPVFPITIVQPRWGGQPSSESAAKSYTLDDIKPTGYDEQAIQSYGVFRSLKDAGKIPQEVRFQVCLPTPLSVVRGFVEDDNEAIPASELTIQWDLPTEVAVLEYKRGRIADRYWKPYDKEGSLESVLTSRIMKLAEQVKPEVEMGFHLCYGDLGHVHFVQPEDMGVMVELANAIVEKVSSAHQIKYIHMPVPKERDDEAYFGPLRDLNVQKRGIKLYLGVVHAEDEGAGGARRKLETARGVHPDIAGIASECGLGRTAKVDVEKVFDTYASLAARNT
ncbi:MAG: hypothetical protein Q9190_001071 [Brigantiaea leucoxantha]